MKSERERKKWAGWLENDGGGEVGWMAGRRRPWAIL